jgi:hypothetical protein
MSRTRRVVNILWFVVALIAALVASALLPVKARAAAHPAGPVAIPFVANAGQAEPDVRFLAVSPGHGLYLAAHEARQVLVRGERGVVLALRFVGANPSPCIEARRPAAARINYLNGSDPRG